MARHPARQAYVEEEMEMVRLPHPAAETDVYAQSETRVLERLADGRTGRIRRALTLTTYVSIHCEQSGPGRYMC
jgi:hypothetical protein